MSCSIGVCRMGLRPDALEFRRCKTVLSHSCDPRSLGVGRLTQTLRMTSRVAASGSSALPPSPRLIENSLLRPPTPLPSGVPGGDVWVVALKTPSYRWGLWVIGSWLTFLAVFAFAAALYLVRGIPHWWTDGSWLALVAYGPLSAGAFGWFFYWFEGRRAVVVKVDDSGVLVRTRKGRDLRANWDSTHFGLTIVTRTAASGKSRASIIWREPRLVPGTAIEPESARELLRALTSRGMVAVEREFGIGRRKTKYAHVRESARGPDPAIEH